MEISEDIIKELFKIAKIPVPENLSEADVLNAIINIKEEKDKNSQGSEFNQNFGNNNFEYNFSEDGMQSESDASNGKSVLIIDDIGVVTYQLKVLFSRIGYKVQVANNIFKAISIFTKSKFNFLIMDLFVSTEQEGYTLLEEAKKHISKNNLDTKIIVITASNKTENKIKCLNGGANAFLRKEPGWQDKLLEIVENHNNEN